MKEMWEETAWATEQHLKPKDFLLTLSIQSSTTGGYSLCYWRSNVFPKSIIYKLEINKADSIKDLLLTTNLKEKAFRYKTTTGKVCSMCTVCGSIVNMQCNKGNWPCGQV